MKAADISEIEVLRFIDRMSRAPWPVTGEPNEGQSRWVMIWDFEQETEWDDVPIKVIRAKLHKLVDRGLLDGCTCGCRGDFELTVKGYEVLRNG